MKKTFCDICEQPMEPNSNARKHTPQDTSGKTEVGFKIWFGTNAYRISDDQWAGDVCKGCLFDAIAKLDDRLKAIAEPAPDLLAALVAIDKELTEFFDDEQVCDHSVGMCSCGYHRIREQMRDAIKAATP